MTAADAKGKTWTIECPECGGRGEVYWTATGLDDDGEPIEVKLHDACPTCGGTGRIPVEEEKNDKESV